MKRAKHDEADVLGTARWATADRLLLVAALIVAIALAVMCHVDSGGLTLRVGLFGR